MGVVVFLHKVTSPTTGLTCIIQKSYSRIRRSVWTGIVLTTLNYVEKSKEKKYSEGGTILPYCALHFPPFISNRSAPSSYIKSKVFCNNNSILKEYHKNWIFFHSYFNVYSFFLQHVSWHFICKWSLYSFHFITFTYIHLITFKRLIKLLKLY